MSGSSEERIGQLVGPEPTEGEELVHGRAIRVERPRLADLVTEDSQLLLLQLNLFSDVGVVDELIRGDCEALGSRVELGRVLLLLGPVKSLLEVNLDQLDLEGVLDRKL